MLTAVSERRGLLLHHQMKAIRRKKEGGLSLWDPRGRQPCQAPLSGGFSRQEDWSGGWPFPPPGNHPDPGIEPVPPALQADSLRSVPPGNPQLRWKLGTICECLAHISPSPVTHNRWPWTTLTRAHKCRQVRALVFPSFRAHSQFAFPTGERQKKSVTVSYTVYPSRMPPKRL